MRIFQIAVFCSCFVAMTSCNMLGGTGLTTQMIIDGLKEALAVGTGNAVSATSKAGGFANDPTRRIELPGALGDVSKALNTLGLGNLIDNLGDKMNVAAEHASSQAGPVFIDAITKMTFADAKQILDGHDTAATDYFRERTRPGLLSVYTPIVKGQLEKVGVVKQYNDILGHYNKIPFTKKPNLSLEDYVTNKALDVLFDVLAGEEKLIRTDPAARVTALLQKVFAGQ